MRNRAHDSHHLTEGVCDVGHVVQGVGDARGVEVYGVLGTWMLCPLS
jgi:hypothetical protein